MNPRRVTDLVILHHSASPATTTLSDIRRWHTAPPPDGRGWEDVGYHWVVLVDGTVEAGRDESLVGAHCLGLNYRSVGVCLVGNFADGVPVPPAQWAAAVGLVAEICHRYGIVPGDVRGHGEIAATACPGFEPADFRRALTASLGMHQEA